MTRLVVHLLTVLHDWATPDPKPTPGCCPARITFLEPTPE